MARLSLGITGIGNDEISCAQIYPAFEEVTAFPIPIEEAGSCDAFVHKPCPTPLHATRLNGKDSLPESPAEDAVMQEDRAAGLGEDAVRLIAATPAALQSGHLSASFELDSLRGGWEKRKRRQGSRRAAPRATDLMQPAVHLVHTVFVLQNPSETICKVGLRSQADRD